MRSVGLTLISLPLLMMTLPYLAFRPSGMFRMDAAFTVSEHLVFMTLFSSCVLGGAWLILGKQARPHQSPLPQGSARKYLISTAWVMWFVFVLSYVTMLPAIGSFRNGDFITARTEVSFAGVGIFYRLYIIAMPVIFNYEKKVAIKWLILVITLALTMLRSYIFSERSTMFELVSVVFICQYFRLIRIPAWALVISLVIMAALFVATFSSRMSSQSHRGASDELHQAAAAQGSGQAAQSTSIIYYYDTQNKAYAMMLDLLPKFKYKSFSQFIEVFANREEQTSLGDNYAAENAHSGYVNASLTNPGGLTEDFSDFWYFGILLAIAKFYLVAYTFASSTRNHFAFCLLPFLFVWLVEYPRFNYYYLPFVAALMFIALAWLAFGRLYGRSGQPFSNSRMVNQRERQRNFERARYRKYGKAEES